METDAKKTNVNAIVNNLLLLYAFTEFLLRELVTSQRRGRLGDMDYSPAVDVRARLSGAP